MTPKWMKPYRATFEVEKENDTEAFGLFSISAKNYSTRKSFPKSKLKAFHRNGNTYWWMISRNYIENWTR